MEYFDFVLNIKDAGDGRFELSAQSDTMGHATGVVSFALDSPQMAAAQQRLADGPIDRDFLTTIGGTLSDALFTGEVRDLYHESLGRVQHDDDKGLRLRLCIDPPALSALPWELAYDRTRDTFLATLTETPLTHISTCTSRSTSSGLRLRFQCSSPSPTVPACTPKPPG